jgi:UDP-glucose 4-epimerase
MIIKKNIIVVTGGAGFVGSNLIKFLLIKTNLRIISLDNYSTGVSKNHINNSRVKYLKGSTTEINTKLNIYKKKINTIFHFGEYARIHQSFKDINECFNSNIEGTSKVFLFCLKHKIKIIYSATSASLGNNGLDQGLSPYAFSKSKNIKMLIYLKKWFGLSYEALYFYNVYGDKQITSGRMATVIGIFEKNYLMNKPMPVVMPGTQTRKFTHIDDTVNGCYLAWKKNLNRHYSVSHTKNYSMIQVAKMFSPKIKFLQKRLGERYKSSVVKKIDKIKIYNIKCNKSLKKYISDFKIKN